MKYWECVKTNDSTPIVDINPSISTEQSEIVVVEPTEIQSISSSNDLRSSGIVIDCHDIDLSKPAETAPIEYSNTILNDDEIANVVSMLTEFQEKYFGKVPLADKLEDKFIWNIPRPVYEAADRARVYGKPDSLNPIYWLYLCCTAEPEDMIGKFLITAINIIPDDEYAAIEKNADTYDEEYLGVKYNDKDEDVTEENED